MSTATDVHDSSSAKYQSHAIPLWAAGIPQDLGLSDRISARKLFAVALTVATFALLVFLTAFPVRAAENVVRIGYQKSRMASAASSTFLVRAFVPVRPKT